MCMLWVTCNAVHVKVKGQLFGVYTSIHFPRSSEELRTWVLRLRWQEPPRWPLKLFKSKCSTTRKWLLAQGFFQFPTLVVPRISFLPKGTSSGTHPEIELEPCPSPCLTFSIRDVGYGKIPSFSPEKRDALDQLPLQLANPRPTDGPWTRLI